MNPPGFLAVALDARLSFVAIATLVVGQLCLLELVGNLRLAFRPTAKAPCAMRLLDLATMWTMPLRVGSMAMSVPFLFLVPMLVTTVGAPQELVVSMELEIPALPIASDESVVDAPAMNPSAVAPSLTLARLV